MNVSLKLDTKGPINNILALIQMMARRLPFGQALFEPMLAKIIDTYMRNSASMN